MKLIGVMLATFWHIYQLIWTFEKMDLVVWYTYVVFYPNPIYEYQVKKKIQDRSCLKFRITF